MGLNTCELVQLSNENSITDSDLNNLIRLFSVSFHYESVKAVQHDRNKLEHLPSDFAVLK